MTLILEWSVRAVLMAAGTAAALRMLRVQSAAAKHAAWTAVLAAMLLTPAWTAWGPQVGLPVLPAGETADLPIPEREPASLVMEAVSAPATSARIVEAEASISPSTWEWQTVLLYVYLLGAGAMLTMLLVGTARALRLAGRAKRGAQAKPGAQTWTSPDCATPVTVGWLHPAILLPADWRDWPAQKLQAVLIHEGEHARRRDPLVQWLALMNRAIFWFHPLAWWLERKLAGLAEEVCDAAVLRQGHDPGLYSEYLIDFASAVRRAGGRLPAWSAAMDGTDFSSRIERILGGTPAQPLSRKKALAAAALCGLALATFGACSVERARQANPGQLSMNEMAKREGAVREQKAADDRTMLEEARKFTPEQAAEKLAGLKADPQVQRTFWQMMRYYEFQSDLAGKNALILWYIEHAPEGAVRPWNIAPNADRAAYERGKALWLSHVNKAGASADLHERAAAFLQGADMPQAEEILLAGRKAHPEDGRWARLLSTHYAMALLGAAEPLTEYQIVRSYNVEQSRGPYARGVRVQLEASTDGVVVAQSAQALAMRSRGPGGRMEPETLALAEKLAARAVALDSASPLAAGVQFRVRQAKDAMRMGELRTMPAEQRKQLDGPGRLLLARWEMGQAWTPAGKNPNLDLTAEKARELLELARQSPGEDRSNYALFAGNIQLAKVALRRGDPRESARYLLLAADAPESEELRYQAMEMNLPRTLIDWGERDAAAQFLERVAPKTARSQQFRDWAAQIRKGENPNLIPTMIGCGQEPC